MKKILIFLLIIIVNYLNSQYNNSRLIVRKVSGGYEIEFSLPEMNYSTVNQSGEEFIRYDIEGFGITPEAGLPMLPQLSFNLITGKEEISPGYAVISKSVDEQILDKKIYPTQEPWEKSKLLSERPFTINREYYNTAGNIGSANIRVSKTFIIAGVKAVTVTIFPFNYDPSSNRLIISKNIRFRVNLYSSMPVYPAVSESFKELFNCMFVNPNVISFTPTNNYLIITAPEYESAMTSFASYKTGMGYNVLMVNTGVTGTTNTAILSYIQNRYNNINTRPEFILLVGDVDKIPEWIGIGSDNPHTDLNYTLLEGSDPYADAFIGRFPVANTSQLANTVNKSIYMESNIGSLPKKSIFMASTDNYTISEGTHNFVIDSFFAPQNYTYLKLYSHTYGATTQQLINALNANQSYAVYSGHGSVTSWADGPPLNQSQVSSLTNTVFPFVYSFACLTGQFQNSECFGETWIRGPKAGSVFWGSSVNSFWDEDDILEKRVLRAKFVDGLKKTAPMFVMGKYYLVQYYGSVTTTMRRYLEMYNCFGDPSIYQAAFGPVIAHNPLPNTENMNGPYTVNCTITPAGSNIDPSKTRIFWTRGTIFNDSVSMTNSGGNNWTANIPGNSSPNTYRYYIKTADLLNRVTASPGGAPANYYTFTAAPDVTPPVIIHTQLANIGQPMWPVAVTNTVTDNIGIDSVWVDWYKNNPSVIKHFRLVNISGNIFSALFNSINSEVAAGDSIFYFIKARDNSSNHNTAQLPPSGYFKFYITSQAYTSFCRQTYVPIRDNMTSYDTFYISGHGIIVDFNFRMETLLHTYDGDILFTIKSPAGQEVTLANSRGGSGDNYINTVFNDSAATPIANGTAPFTGSFKPESPLDIFNGQDMFGNWVFKVSDMAGGDTGRVERYCLNIIYNTILSVTQNQIPLKFELSQNYPNPFNPFTRIEFSIPKQSNVTLTVYDILGREVEILVNGIMKPGNFEVIFNGINYASGVYFYRIEAGDLTEVRKMILIK